MGLEATKYAVLAYLDGSAAADATIHFAAREAAARFADGRSRRVSCRVTRRGQKTHYERSICEHW